MPQVVLLNAKNTPLCQPRSLAYYYSIAPKHAVHKIPKRTPKILSACQVVFIDEKNVMLETRIQMSLKTKLTDDWVMVTVNMSIHTIHALENLPNHVRKRLWERNALQ
jgi:hypothetical protein